ncbi:NAD(P)-binding protein [Macrolepiota fuliginosa MF-IS2]|uniref:NAD(P)-binding protein n=1 Tax=Macrolepiota fuliginosa MF-IS2 TaxID=1400762 RepID=A0A9P5X8H8_9AGAR|nr:NAD(P)-binding protein [Macrolepiota fuliginosa MF-IS2]
MSAVTVLWVFLSFSTLLALYVYTNDRKITRLPDDYESLTTKGRCTPADVRETAARLAQGPLLSIDDQLPPKTGRRYIIVGGGGFLGGWIATQLLDRGEHPSHIRLLDLRPPPSTTLKSALKTGVQFIKVDVSDPDAVLSAFSSPWPTTTTTPTPITVFHTAANIRFYERFVWQLPFSARVNVEGTRNVVEAAVRVGADVLVYTSSGSIGIRSNRFLLWPWEAGPRFHVQVIGDGDQGREAGWMHEDFFSNYAVSKRMGEGLVREANGRLLLSEGSKKVGKVLRTGCIRPGNGVFGPRGDMLCGAYVARKTNPTWIQHLISSHCYVENCALAHLLYEQRLVALSSSPSPSSPDISGQAFNIRDPGPTPTNGDVFTTLTTLTAGECHFPFLSPTFMLLVAHLIEFYYTLPDVFFTHLRFPRVTGSLINLQPSLFSLVQVHLVFDDSRARLGVGQGGLGYKGGWTTLEALHKTVEEHYKSLSEGSVRADISGINLHFKFGWGRKKVGGVGNGSVGKPKVVEVTGKDVVNGIVPVEVVSL